VEFNVIGTRSPKNLNSNANLNPNPTKTIPTLTVKPIFHTYAMHSIRMHAVAKLRPKAGP